MLKCLTWIRVGVMVFKCHLESDEDEEEHAGNDGTTEQGAHGNDVVVVVSSEKVDKNVNHIV
jgi:hypothetical protein